MRYGLVLALLVACGDDDAADASGDAATDAASDAGVDSGFDAGPMCAMTCGFGEACCFVEGEPTCIDVRSDVENCGSCGFDCRDGRGPTCERGNCVCGTVDVGCGGDRNSWCCPGTEEQPQDYCANFDVDGNDCGSCGHACDPAKANRCNGGRCLCGDLRSECGGTPESTCCSAGVDSACVDLTSDPSHCGACGVACLLSERCTSGLCTIGAECSGGCGPGEICCAGACCIRGRCNGVSCEEASDASVPADAGADDDGGADGGADVERVKYLVVGGGISGLAFADWISSEDYLICEADRELGGYCKTVVQDGFVWDYSGHFFHFRHKEIEEYLVARMKGQRVLEVEKDSRIYYAGAYVDFPFQKNIHQLPKDELLDCLYDLYFREEQHSGAVTSFRDMLYAKFGKSIAEKFLIPYNEKLYATDLGRLDPDAMGRFFPYAELSDIVRNFRAADNRSYNASFTYPEGGAIQYVHALAEGVDASKISLGERVEAIDLGRKIARTNRREVAFETLVSTMPFVDLLRLTGMRHDPSIYSWNVVEVFNLGFDRPGPEGVHWIYYPQRELSFYRVGFYNNIFGTDRMSLYVELGRTSEFETDRAGAESTLRRVLDDLRATGLVTDHQLASWHHVVLDPAYVHITRRSNADVAAKKRALETRGVHSIGRYGSWTYCSIEDNIVEARALADACNAADGG